MYYFNSQRDVGSLQNTAQPSQQAAKLSPLLACWDQAHNCRTRGCGTDPTQPPPPETLPSAWTQTLLLVLSRSSPSLGHLPFSHRQLGMCWGCWLIAQLTVGSPPAVLCGMCWGTELAPAPCILQMEALQTTFEQSKAKPPGLAEGQRGI